ncbi:hypothetical protein DDB_G0278559 [Dictyostelium discoideum AX4]|uniref:Carbohydrate binding domain-containing protein n=1 Tax=Dictyostelium discoideum TaxID=44689 RepID=Q54XW0_DICDI|nr:hypothetical protein DDB_G0278559 [Dictyostelium discoideum AX4]EAL68452.1 hypothetical protein DDB_G0278559 [Dictyostelium discoideum AX4]|eukprot:XP_642442.1 hypothetical protein DDB_G0278559 [Dictyostelium discoideum AX4]
MKFLAVLCIFIFSVAFAYGCDDNPCGNGTISVTSYFLCDCIDAEGFTDVTINTTKLIEWDMGENHFNIYKVKVHNWSNFPITNVIMSIDSGVLDSSLSLISNDPEKMLTYKRPIARIERNSDYSFAITTIGFDEPNIILDAVTF